MTARWQLVEHGGRNARLFTIELDGVRVADAFPDAGMYLNNKVAPEWVIEQAQLIVDTMNAYEATP